MTLEVALDALRHDAGIWDDVSHVLECAGEQAQGLVLGEAQLSWAGSVTGLAATYAQIQAKVATLLAEGSRETFSLSVALDRVASAYEMDDENAAARLRGVWEVRD